MLLKESLLMVVRILSMKKELYFMAFAIKKNIRSSAELRTSFVMNVFGMFLNNIAFVLIWLFLIQTVGEIGGWNSAYIFGLQGFTALAYGLFFSFFYGISNITSSITSGAMDRYLLSPKNLLLRISLSSFSASAVGDIIFGVVCLIIFAVMIHATLLQIFLIIFFLIAGTITFAGFIIFIQSIAFYINDAGNITQSLFELFFTPTLFHGGAFQGNMRLFFTFLIPSLVIGTLPTELVVNFSLRTCIIVVLLAFFWCTFSIWFFYQSLKRYESANFMTFGQ